MGTVAFQWEDSKLTLLMNRNNYEGQVTKKATWDESNTILGSWFDKSLTGTWFGVSKSRRIAFMVEPLTQQNGGDDELLEYITRFLKGAIDLHQFSSNVVDICKNRESTNAVVVDLGLKWMVYFQKEASSVPVSVKDVGHGVHTLSDTGLDSESPKDVRLRDRYHDVIAESEPPINVLVQEIMTDLVETEQGDKESSVFIDLTSTTRFQMDSCTELERYGTTSSTALEVQLSGGQFYQKFLVNGQWKEDGFPFSMGQ